MKKTYLILFIITIAISGCTTANNNQSKENNKSDGVSDNSANNTTDVKKYGVGEAVEINGVKITFESVDMSYGDRDEEYSAFAPEEGKVFAVCNFLVENNSKEDLNISDLYFSAYEDGFAIDSYIFTDGIGVESLSGTASPGKKIKGAIVY